MGGESSGVGGGVRGSGGVGSQKGWWWQGEQGSGWGVAGVGGVKRGVRGGARVGWGCLERGIFQSRDGLMDELGVVRLVPVSNIR